MSSGFTREELESISERALRLAKEVGDPGMRISLQLLGEAAANVAAKLPGETLAPAPRKDRGATDEG